MKRTHRSVRIASRHGHKSFRRRDGRYRVALAGAIAAATLVLSAGARADTFLDLSGGLGDWTTSGTVSILSSTDSFSINGEPYSLTPAEGYSMAKIVATGATNANGANTALGLSMSSLQNFLGNDVTNFGYMTRSFNLNAGTYTFGWAYAALDYVPFNDGVFFSLAGGGTQEILSLARNGTGDSDTSGPSPGTLILGSYGTTPWQAASFSIATAGSYQLGFGAYNWDDMSLNPNLFISGVTGSYTGTPPETQGGLPPVLTFGTTGGNVSASIFDTSSAAYGESTLEFEGGTLQYAADTTTAKDTTLAAGGGTLDTNGHEVTYSGFISGAGTLEKDGAGTLLLSAANTYTGATTVSAGTLALTGNGSIADSAGLANNGTFDISATSSGAALKTISGAGTVLLGSQTLTLTAASGTYSGVIGGTGGLQIQEGSETLSGVNAYSGATVIANGASLVLAGAGSVAASSGITNSGTLDVSATTSGATISSLTGSGNVALGGKSLTLTNASGTFSGAIGGTGAVTVAGGTSTLSGANTYEGATSIASGATLALSGSASIAESSGVSTDGTFDVSGADAPVSIKTLAGTGTVTLGANTLSLTQAAGSFAGSIGGDGSLLVGGGTQTLSGVNTYSGGTTISGDSSVVIAADAALGATSGALTLDGGTLSSTASLTSARAVALTGGGTLSTASGTTFTGSGEISGSGHLIKTGEGTLVLAGSNEDWGAAGDAGTGGLTIQGGTVRIANPSALGHGTVSLSSGVFSTDLDVHASNSMTLGAGTTLSTDADSTVTLSGTIGSSGSGTCFYKAGPGALVMSGPVTLGNGTCVLDGRLFANGTLNSQISVEEHGTLRGVGSITGPVTVHGALAPGNSPGLLTIASSVIMMDGSIYQQDINGTGTGTGPGSYSRLVVLGADSTFTADGATLVPNLVGITGAATYTPYVPALGDSFRIITAEGGIEGQFAGLVQPEGLDPATRLQVFYDAGHSVDLRVLPLSYGAFSRAHGGNRNAQAAAAAIDAIAATEPADQSSAQQELRYAISGLNSTGLAQTTTALSGEIHGALAAVAPQTDQWLLGTVARQIGAVKGRSRSDASPDHAIWVDVSTSSGEWTADAAASDFEVDRTQVALGYDLHRGDNTLLGVGFSHTDAEVSAASGSGTVRQHSGFLYAQQAVGRLSFEGVAGFGSTGWDTGRADPLGAAELQSDAHGDTSFVSAGTRWQWRTGSVSLQPYARLMWQEVSRSGFVESGDSAAALTLRSLHVSGWRGLVGLSGGSAGQNPLAERFTWQFDLGAALEQASLVRAGVLASLAGEATTIVTPEVGRSALLGNFTITSRLMKRGYMFLGVSAETRDGKSDAIGANAGMRVSF